MLSQEQKRQLIEYIDKADEFKNNNNLVCAIDCYKKVLEINPELASVYSILANLYAKAYGDKSLNEQVYCYKKLLEFKPDSSLALHGLAFCSEKLGNNEEAQKYYQHILQNSPTDIDYYNYGMFLIHAGNFEDGHKYFTHRFNIDDINLHYPLLQDIEKKWDFKTDLTDKTLLVHYEQGFGDSIMYCRFLPELAKLTKKLIFVVQPELYNLIKYSDKISASVEIRTSAQNVEYDYNMALLDAPYALGVNSKNLPFAQGYLNSPSQNIESKKFKMGISYAGDKNANYNGRDLTLKDFSRLLDIDDIEIYSLQKDELQSFSGIISLGKNFSDFADTAQAIKSMDLVISTDNVILNLSGALGVKTFGLFNKDTNFRWFCTSGENVGWYTSVIPLQCRTFNDWDYVFERLHSLIATELTMRS